MASQAQIAANRRNAQASTGPRTPEGKARARRNAVTHGLCAETTPDAGEDAAAFAALYRSLMNTYQPLTLEEQAQVARIASIKWRLSRVPAVENALCARMEEDAANDVTAAADLPALWAAALMRPEGQRAHTALQRYEAHLARQLASAHQAFRTMRKTLHETHPPLVYLADDPEWAEASEYGYVDAATEGEGWSPDGLLPAHGLTDAHAAANDPGPAPEETPPNNATHPEEGPQAPSRTAEEPSPEDAAHPEEAPTAPSRRAEGAPRSYPEGHETYGDPLRMHPKMTKDEVAAWRPEGDDPQPGNYVYPDGRMRFWPGDAPAGEDNDGEGT